jgi:asparagine synthase (glutamine-hydrolysing)
MCGICGKFNFDGDSVPVDAELIGRMLNSIRHRGPDDEGVYLSPQIGLGHRRLSIIDLNTGHQPLSNEDGSVWIVFNGEIYNYRELRSFLLGQGHVFKTQSDTEVIVHLYEEYGPACVEKLRGMFAFAIWNQKDRSLFLARDRVGIKPLYYSATLHSIVFGSEIKAILQDPSVAREVAPGMLDRFLTFYFLPGEETLFQGISKLAPGHWLLARNGTVQIRQYWELDFARPTNPRAFDNAKDELSRLLAESVELHMIADVPVGILLSGGVDSTAMLSYAVERTGKTVNSYTVGFAQGGIPDERPYARLAADTYGAHHHEMTISAQDFVDFLPRYVWHMEDPVCEPPAVAMFYVSRLASQDVKVLISGEGGDEAFGGYSNYRNILWLERFKSLFGPLNGSRGKLLGAASRLLRSKRLAKYVPLMDISFPDYYYSRSSGPGGYFNSQAKHFYAGAYDQQTRAEHSLEPLRRYLSRTEGLGSLDRMLYVDTKTWLPDDLLLKADKMTMANSLELRVPFLDHNVLEFAAALPSDWKVRWFTTKFIAKRALAGRVPRQIVERRKAGFPVPYEHWIQTDLHGWFRDLLLDSRTVNRGYFSKSAVEGLLDVNRQSGLYAKEIFSLATLELWHRVFLEQEVPVAA